MVDKQMHDLKHQMQEASLVRSTVLIPYPPSQAITSPIKQEDSKQSANYLSTEPIDDKEDTISEGLIHFDRAIVDQQWSY